MTESNGDAWAPEDTIRVLIASDIHLGHLESDAVRGDDSFVAFEEVLSLAVQCDVDLVLLGGDLFDHAKPSPGCLFRCTQLIRKYCFGDKPVALELLSDQLGNFSRNVNYEDPDLNVSYPILSIHGNHDDPVGQRAIGSLDILSISGLVNYFGKWSDYSRVRVSPVLLRKGASRLALYGLSHLKDARLARLFQEQKVEMELPEDGHDWFNMLVLHQNRADRGPGNYIREEVLPAFLDLVVWGHEHDSLVFPIKGKKQREGFSVVQPGSTVATSLAAGESLPKHCALLQLHKDDMILTPMPLKTVRPFIFKTIVLSEENLGEEDVNESEKVQAFLRGRVQDAIAEAERNRSGDERQPTVPLVRLNVFYERESQNFNHMRFGQNFAGAVANPGDILNMRKEKRVRERKPGGDGDGAEDAPIEGAAHAADVEELLRAYYAALPPERRLHVLSVRALTDAVRDFTLKHDDEVFKRAFEAHKRRCVELLLESGAETEEEVAERLRTAKAELDAADAEQLRRLIDAAASKPPTPGALKRAIVVLSSDDDDDIALAAGRGRGRGRGAGARGRGRGARGGRRTEPEPAPAPRSPAPERRTPRRSAAQKSASWLQSYAERGSRNRRGSIEIDDSD